MRIHKIELSDQIGWWTRNNSGSFNLELYIRICEIKVKQR